MEVYFNLLDHFNPFSIESIGYMWEQPMVLREEGYPYYHWLQTAEGLGEVTIANEKIQLHPQEGILIAPFVPHFYESISAKGWRTNFMTINGTFSASIAEILGTSSYYLANDCPDFSYSDWTQRMLSHIKNENKNSVQQKLSVDVYNFLLNIRDHGLHRTFQKNDLYHQYISPTIEWIETNYGEKCDISEIAGRLFISPQYLNKLFRRFVGISVYQYVLAYRIKKAKEILVTKRDVKIKDITFLTGFNDTSHFVATFKKETGYTPKEFRSFY
ncbi:AraC family transcriptional regulator [Niallia sp. Sow4_A1]|jgi:AraC-like DNA-binding protein|uniref:AraC family transcriptional regulator n=1 Tax=unclassified Niallia TaxID=2837522 RepID=UPI00203C4BDA|nr:AraC family transcriptional regulator [Niallia sp. MER TA 168]MCM3362320.1 AraC family transcriptional regulator [Niallia sp. MER TA 168]